MNSSDHRQFSRSHVMIACAPNGARRMPKDHPDIPITPRGLARAAAPLSEAGVSVLHLHVRDPQGRHTLDVGCYRSAISAIRDEIGDRLVIQVTTESVGLYSTAQQMAVVRELRPEAVSLALRELCPDQAAEAEAARFFEWLCDNQIWPQYILYSPLELARFDALRRGGFFGQDHPSCLLVLGNYAEQVDGSVEQLETYLGAIDTREFPWTACCFGAGEQAVLLSAESRGGHVRLGFENNLHLPDGGLARDNLQLIRRFTANLCGPRRPATADQVRNAFLPP